MIGTFDAVLPHGITLHCRAAGRPDAPRLLFLHGFPEAAFIWDPLLEHFGATHRCIAPDLRGFGGSSAPPDIDAYRPRQLMSDIAALVERSGGPVEALVGHDWGGAIAWNLAAQMPQLMRRLVIVNSPHPATFLRELQHDAAQQSASAYMNFLCRPDAEALLAADDFARMWPLFENMGAIDTARAGGGWLTDALRERYREVWRRGLTGGCNLYRASPLRPPVGPDDAVMALRFAPEFVTSRVPTTVLWGMDDIALRPSLLEGLDAWVPELTLVRVPGATHWIVHERPAFVIAQVEAALAR